MTRQTGLLVAFRPVVSLFRLYTVFVWLVFRLLLLLLQQNKKYKVVHILAYLSRLDIAARTNGKPCRVSAKKYEEFPDRDLISAPKYFHLAKSETYLSVLHIQIREKLTIWLLRISNVTCMMGCQRPQWFAYTLTKNLTSTATHTEPLTQSLDINEKLQQRSEISCTTSISNQRGLSDPTHGRRVNSVCYIILNGRIIGVGKNVG